MKAVMLCCDKYLISAYHTIITYEHYIPDNEFTFLVPYNDVIPEYINKLKSILNERLILIKCENKFKTTMTALLNEIPDEEFIYWCFSDNYIHQILDREKFIKVKNSIEDGYNNEYDVVAIVYNKKYNKMRKELPKVFLNNIEYLVGPKWDNPVFNIWNHQFMKAKLLKKIWELFDEPKKAKELDYQLMNLKHRIYKDPVFNGCKNIYLDEKIIRLGENTSRGLMTANAYEHYKKLNLDENLINIGINMEKSLLW